MSSAEQKQDDAAAPTAPAAAAAAPPPAPAETPLTKLTARLPEITKKADYGEMWGVPLAEAGSAPAQVVLQKFLRANSGDVAAAEKQLTAALEWRRKMRPATLVDEVFDSKKFGDLGYVTTHQDEKGAETVVTWNIYGAVKDNKATFGDVNEFIRWRTALMELGVQKLHLNAITTPIADGDDAAGADPHMMIQVHDYMSVSFFRMDPAVKAASRETIQTFSTAYPELLSHKYFVNVPALAGWVYAAMKLFLAPATLKKFHPMASGTSLAAELKGIGALPKEYGGKGPSVKEGQTVKLGDKDAQKKEEKEEEEVGAPAAAAAAEMEPAEESKPADEANPVEEAEAAEQVKAAEEVKSTEEAEPAEEVKAGEHVKPAEESTTVTEALPPAEAAKPDVKELDAAPEGADKSEENKETA